VTTMMTGLLSMARSGALDGALLATPQLYSTDYTKPLLFHCRRHLPGQPGHRQGT